jgi:hypothetical protein
VVWTLDEVGERRSFLLDSVAGKVTIAGEQAGAWFLFRGGVYRFAETSVRRSSTDCSTFFEPKEEPAEDGPPLPEKLDLEVNGAVAERVDRAGNIELVPIQDVENAESFDNSLSLAASAGSRLFIESHSDQAYCGAMHGYSTHTVEAFDLERGAFHEFPEKAELATLRSDTLKRKRAEFLTCVTPYARQIAPDFEPSNMLDDLRIAAVIPRFSERDGFQVELGWAITVAYAFGTGEWGSYSSACPPTMTPVTKALKLEPPPRSISTVSARFPKATIGGWSTLAAASASPEDIAALERAFRTPAPDVR